MDSVVAFCLGDLNRNKVPKVFDWNKAARLIRDTKPSRAFAGLKGDWEFTGEFICEDGKPAERDSECGGVCLASTWAIPELDMDGEIEPCWVWADDEKNNPDKWNSSTYWPQSALNILYSI